MAQTKKASQSFRFFTRLHLTELTGLKASNLKELLQHTKAVSGSSIYHHTHRFLQQHQYLSPEPPNDFAYWVTQILGENQLGEKLASIDTVRFHNIRSLREEIIRTIKDHIKDNPTSKKKFANKGAEFFFLKSVSFVIPTNYIVTDLKEFVEIIKKITIDSIYFHIFESRLRLEKEANDFSYWIESALGEKALAEKIASLDPYTQTLEDLRKSIIAAVSKRIS